MNEIEPPAKLTLDLSYDSRVEQFRRALKVGNRSEICLQIEAAGEQGITQSVPYLAAVLHDRDRWRDRLARNRPYRRRIKLAAVESLRKIGNLFAVESLVLGLFDPDELVNRQTACALASFGSDAVAPILRILEYRSEWTVPQMRLLIETLGEIGDPRCGPALARVLLGLSPQSSTRWSRRTFVIPALVVMASAGMLLFLALLSTSAGGNVGSSLTNFFITFVLCLGFGGLAGLFLFLPFFFLFLLPMGISWSNTELAALTRSAADVLVRLEDKRSLPSVIQAAYAGRRKSQPAARRALVALLPLLKEGDAGLLPPASLQMLLDSIAPMRQALLPQSPDLTVAIVHALRHVGPGAAAETVRKLENLSDAPQVRIACREVLPILLARREQERASSSLLRASAPPATSHDQLLRAASASADARPNELLRPME